MCARALPCQEADPPYPGFDVRYGILPGADLGALVNRSATIGMQVTSFVDPSTGKKMLRGFGEIHALFDVPIEAMAASYWDFEAQPGLFPNLIEARVEASGEGWARVFQYVGVSILGLKVGYRMRLDIRRDELPGGAIGYRSRLLECLDGNMFESYSSTYLESVLVDGRPMTYIRVYSRPGIADPFPGTAMIVKGLTPGELRNSVLISLRDARRRASQYPR